MARPTSTGGGFVVSTPASLRRRVQVAVAVAVLALGILPGLVSAKTSASTTAMCANGTATATWANTAFKVASVQFTFTDGGTGGVTIQVSPPKNKGSVSTPSFGASMIQVSWFNTSGAAFAFTGPIGCGILGETPNPLVFPNANVGGGTCGAVGSTSCTYASITITNGTAVTQTITTASTGTTIFWPTYGGTCNVTYAFAIPSGASCTFEFGFEPTTTSTTYTDTGTVNFDSGAALSVGLSGTSNAPLPNLIVSAITIDAPTATVFYYTATIENIGTVSADVANAVVQGWYSVDTILDSSDTAACGSIISGSSLTLAPGQSTDVLIGCGTFPPAGDNYLIVTVNDNNAVTESDYTNNSNYVPLT